MPCDNCGAEIDKKEEYCPECGMELLSSVSKPKKKKYYKDPAPISHENSYFQDKPQKKEYYRDPEPVIYKDSFHDKPLKKKYYENPDHEYYEDASFQEEYGYEDQYLDDDEEYVKTDRSWFKTSHMLLLLFIALLLGFLVGLLMFSTDTQLIPPIPTLHN